VLGDRKTRREVLLMNKEQYNSYLQSDHWQLLKLKKSKISNSIMPITSEGTLPSLYPNRIHAEEKRGGSRGRTD